MKCKEGCFNQKIKMKIIVDDKIPYIRGRVEWLADQVVYLPGNAITPEDVRDADALIVRTRTRCDRRLLEGSRVRFIVTATIGYDHLDTAYLDEAGITWTNCPGCNAGSVAQYIRNSLILLDQAGIVDLAKATVGIVGMGHVGCAVHEAISPYVGRILMNDPPLEEKLRASHSTDETAPFFLYNNNRRKRLSAQTCKEADDDLAFTSLDTLISSCDILTFHTPLIIDGPHPTYHLADEAFLSGLQRKPVLINAARGGVVDDTALERALDAGLVRAAVIDTWEGEPDIRLSLLRKTFIGTPHIAGYSADGKANATRMALEALECWEKERGIFREPAIGDIEIMDTIAYSALGRSGASGEVPANPLSLYNPLDDSLRLKQSPEQFEYQRGNYPVRYEKER